MIAVNAFRGARPKVSDKLLEQGQAKQARNCKLESGALRPLRAPALHEALTHTGDLQSLYLFARQFWFAWDSDVDVVRGAIPTDTTEQTYWTGDGYPKMTNAAMATAGGGTDYPNNHYQLGVPAPANAPQVEIAQDWSGTVEQDSDEYHVWVYTYVNSWGQEGPPSSASIVLERARDDSDGSLQPVDITSDTAPTGPVDIVTKRFYRLNTGESGQEYQYLGETPVAQTDYQDTAENDELAEVLPSTEWDPPPEDLNGLVALPNGVMAGFVGKDLYLSEPYRPHAWPRSYMQTVDYDIVGLGTFGNNVVVCTEGQPYLGTGVDPASIVLQKIELEQACVSKRSIARMGLEGVVYASPDGLVLVGPGSASVVTHDLFSKDEWELLAPESIAAFSHDQSYVAFYDTGAEQGCFVMDAKVDGIIHVDAAATGGYVDLLTDTLYLLIDGDVYEWDAGDPLEMTWTSKVWSGRLTSWSMAQVLAAEYPTQDPLTLKVYGDGVLRFTKTVANDEPFRLPADGLSRDWQFDISGKASQVDAVVIGHMEHMT